jgi:hypothetical protein
VQVKLRRLDGAEIDQSTKPASDWSGLDEEDEQKTREGNDGRGMRRKKSMRSRSTGAGSTKEKRRGK